MRSIYSVGPNLWCVGLHVWGGPKHGLRLEPQGNFLGFMDILGRGSS
jgi:hypothetical protein